MKIDIKDESEKSPKLAAKARKSPAGLSVDSKTSKPKKLTKAELLKEPKSLNASSSDDANITPSVVSGDTDKIDETSTEIVSEQDKDEVTEDTEEQLEFTKESLKTSDVDDEQENPLFESDNSVDSIDSEESEVSEDSDELEEPDGLKINDFADDTELDPNKTIEEIVSNTERSKNAQGNIISDTELEDLSIEEDTFNINQNKVEVTPILPVKNVAKRGKIRRAFSYWWNHKLLRNLTIAAVLISVSAAALIPDSRYYVLNTLGVRVESSLRVLDSQTRRPLRNISVKFQGKELKTDEDGLVKYSDLMLGRSELIISKRGYAEDKSTIVLGWGSNPLADKALQATGEQYIFVLRDWQTDQPIADAEAIAGENSATADESGKIVLIIGEEDISDLKVSIVANGYRTEMLSVVELNDSEKIVKMVPGRRHAFVSNRDGKFDLYAVDIDGKNEKLILEASKKERQTPLILEHPSRNLIALVSSRNGDLNTDGFTLDGLFLVNSETGEQERIARSERIKLLGWSGDTLVFWQIVEGTSANNPLRSKLIAYNEKTKERRDIASANYFNDVELILDTVYYAVSSFAVPQSQAKLYSSKVTAPEIKTLIDKQVWNIFRTNYDIMVAHAEDQKWYEIKNELVREIESQSAPTPKKYSNSPDGKTTAWVEIRDGKGTILTSTIENFQEEKKVSIPGLSEVLYWANNDQIVFQLISNSETADYFYSITTGKAQKIRDVTPSVRDNSY